MHITGGVSLYLYVCVSLLIPVCTARFCLCVRYQMRVLAKTMSHSTENKVFH